MNRTSARRVVNRRSVGSAGMPGGVAYRVDALERRLMFAVSFQPAVTTSLLASAGVTGGGVVSTVAADVNNDGTPDLITGNLNGLSEVLLGTSTGVLQPGTLFSTGGSLLAVGDFNGDGIADLATASGVLPGTGKGAFGTTITGFKLPANTVALYAQDVNGDGKMDLVAATFSQGTGSSAAATMGIDVLLGDGKGTFATPVVTTVGSATGVSSTLARFAFGDFNGDGKLDVLTPFGVMLGNGTGGFAAPVPILPGSAGSAPTTRLFVTGDFNGDGKLDIAIVPATSASSSTSSTASSQIDILLGKGDGTFFQRATPIMLSGSVTTLAAADLNADGFIDLIAGTGSAAASSGAGTTSGTGGSAVVVLPGKGDGTFGMPASFSVSGNPIAIYTGDFNADGKVDLLTVDGAAGAVTGTTTIPTGVLASVLLNKTPTPQPPAIALSASANPSVAGLPVALTATLAGTAGVPAPTGMVTFRDGNRVLGTAAVGATGNATLTTTALAAGARSITASYGGDANYTPVNSAALALTVLVTSAHVPAILANVQQVTLPTTFIAGDQGVVTLTLGDYGGAAAVGRVAVHLYASRSGSVDASAIRLAARSLQNVAIRLATGATRTLTATITAVNIPAGSYRIVAQVTPLSGLTSAQVPATPAASPMMFKALTDEFGTVGSHANLFLSLAGPHGARATFQLLGPGTGVATPTATGADVTLTGTTSASVLRISGRSGTFVFGNITANAAIGIASIRNAALTGTLALRGGAGQVILSAAEPGSVISLAAGSSAFVSVGSARSATLTSAAPIITLNAANWVGGRIVAPSINNLIVSGLFQADLLMNGAAARLRSARIGALSGGTWAVPGGIGTLRVLGTISNTRIFAGASPGPDAILGTADDTFGAADIDSVVIGGSDIDSTIAAGVKPAQNGNLLGGLIVLPRGVIRSLSVRGAMSANSRWVAELLPAIVKVAGTRVDTHADPRFET